MSRMLVACMALALGMATPFAFAQSFPTKAVKIVVAFAPGGAGDILARVVAEQMAKGLGQPVIVENKPGAGAVIGYESVARAPADGYTILEVFPSFVINPSLRHVPYDPMKDFRALGLAVSVPLAIAVNPSVPAKTVSELVALARAKPGEMAYGTPGAGTLQHLFGELFRFETKVSINHAPYPGGAPAVTATVGGHIPVVFANVNEVAPSVLGGKLRALAVTGPERSSALPDVPTVAEAGYAAMETVNWAGFVVPAGTPPKVIAQLNAEIARALATPEVQEKLKLQGMLPTPSSPERFAELLQSEFARYAKVVKEAGIKLE